MKRLILALLSILILTACSTYSDEQLTEFDEEIQAYLEEQGKECERSESGLYFNIIDEGEGKKIQFNDVVAFKYKGELLDGEVFDENLDEPVEFQVKVLIQAWKEVMLMLGEGGKAYLVCPPQLGYGDHDLDDIPPNSCLAFELEVVEVK